MLFAIILHYSPRSIFETNPGPVRYPCTMCAKPVRANQRGVMCDTCDLWTHTRCCGISRDEYEVLDFAG